MSTVPKWPLSTKHIWLPCSHSSPSPNCFLSPGLIQVLGVEPCYDTYLGPVGKGLTSWYWLDLSSRDFNPSGKGAKETCLGGHFPDTHHRLVGGVLLPDPEHEQHESHEAKEMLTHDIPRNRRGGCVHTVPCVHV